MNWNKVADALDNEASLMERRAKSMETETGRYGMIIAFAVIKPLARALRAGLQ